MNSDLQPYHQRALTFIDAVDRMSSVDEVINGMQRVLSTFGFDFFCFNNFMRPDQKFEDVMWACRVPPDWLALYLEKDYGRHDPSIEMCRRTVKPFEWREALGDLDRRPQAAEVAQRTIDFGLANALLIPVPGPTGCIGNVWAGGYHVELNSQTKAAAHLMGLYAFDRIRGLIAPRERKQPQLTEREREVLSWIAIGKSAWEIGEILNIAKRTVDEHAQTSFRKLGAANRTHAVAIALRHGIIEV